MIARKLTLAAALVALAATPALAETKLKVEGVAKKAEVALGDDIEIDVTVTNEGDDAELTDLEFDARSVSFEIAIDKGTPAWDVRWLVDPPKSALEPDPLTPIARKTLKKGEHWTKTFTIPAIKAGAWEITTNYGGTTPADVKSLSAAGQGGRIVRLKDAARWVKVNPGPKGETEVGVKITTTVGTMTWAFFTKEALCSSLNFVRIAKSGWYDGKTFHRIDSGLGVVQGGATEPDGGGHFGWSVPRELGAKHVPLAIGMARSSDPNSGGSQFYIVTSMEAAQLDTGYAVFARVVRGKDVVETLAAVKVVGGAGMAGQRPSTTLRIESAKPVLLANQN